MEAPLGTPVSRAPRDGMRPIDTDLSNLSDVSPVLDAMHIFSVADQRQVFAVSAATVGGTWIANDRFVWAVNQNYSTPSGVMQWTPAAGANGLRPEYWYAPTSSPDGGWLAATEPYRLSNQSDPAYPRVMITSADGSRTFQTGLGSWPGFVTPNVVWYAGRRACSTACFSPTEPDGTIHAFNVDSGADQSFRFRVGEEPIADGANPCCFAGAR